MRIGAAFDPRANSLNLIRLLLAIGVIMWHSFPLTGTHLGAPWRELASSAFVDGFFAISGFLIVGSWMRRPEPWTFLRARLLRIFPAFWVALIVTAFVIAPLATLTVGPLGDGYWPAAFRYVWANAGLWIFQYGIDGTPEGVVGDPGSWNGSLWTLAWEFGCYLVVLVLGVVGLLRKSTLVVLFAAALAGGLLVTSGVVTDHNVALASRFVIMFAAGGILWMWRDQVPAKWWLVAVAGVLVVVSAALPSYRLVAALPLAYLLIVTGALLRRPVLRNDLSYGTYIYAFPIQQTLALLGVTFLPVFAGLTVVAVLVIAAASWFLIERPALRLKRPSPATVPAPVAAVAGPAQAG